GGRSATRIGDGNGIVYFQALLPPRLDGDGWVIAGEIGDPWVARLLLPGERPSYGGPDMRQAADARELQRRGTYWVRIGKLRRPAAGSGGAASGNLVQSLPVVRALGAPRRIP